MSSQSVCTVDTLAVILNTRAYEQHRSHIRETLNITVSADRSTDTKKGQKRTETERNGQIRTETDRNGQKRIEQQKLFMEEKKVIKKT